MHATPLEAKSTDEAISTELARANLARLRGDYTTAEALCEVLLQKAPHNANVAALLGDVSAEQGKLEAAVQWYEMSVDSGAPVGIAEKLASVKERVKKDEVVVAEAGIGLPSRTAFSPATLLAVIVVVLMLFVAAYVAGTNHAQTKPGPAQEQQPIMVPASNSQQFVSVPPTSQPPAGTPDTQPTAEPIKQSEPESSLSSAPSTKPNTDSDLAPFLSGASGPLARVTSAVGDPRSHGVLLDAMLQTGDDPRAVAAQIAEAALGKLKDATDVTVRLLANGKPEFIADAPREKFEAYVRSGRTAGTGGELADALLSNEWKAGSETATTGR